MMTQNELNTRYFEWICQLVHGDKSNKGKTYRHLLKALHNTEFIYIIPMDDNRAADGMDLRYRFTYENSFPYPMIAAYLDSRACSVLEMMIALAIRCEEHIMDDPDIGNRTGQWFWRMIRNLGLEEMDDANYEEDRVNRTISTFLHREYNKYGEGGLFTIRDTEKDLRNVEIWYQMCWYLEKIERQKLKEA